MKIILALTDSKRKSIAFVTDSFEVLPLSEMLQLVQENKIKDLHVAKRARIRYLRTNQGPARINIDAISVPWYWVFGPFGSRNLLTVKALNIFWKQYKEKATELKAQGKVLVAVESFYVATKTHVTKVIFSHRKKIFDAAEHFKIDPYLLGAILVDEIVRRIPFLEADFDYVLMKITNRNVSVGVGQVTLETAQKLIKAGYYNPNLDDKKLAPEQVTKQPIDYFFQYLKDDVHNIFFAAARIRELFDSWETKLSPVPPVIITTLYHLPYKPPRSDPDTNARGRQIMKEFYPLAKEILGDV